MRQGRALELHNLCRNEDGAGNVGVNYYAAKNGPDINSNIRAFGNWISSSDLLG